MSMVDKPERLLWIDMESTGLNREHDALMEVEMRVTDTKGIHEYARTHAVIHDQWYTRHEFTHDSFVQEHHVPNGLIGEVQQHPENTSEVLAQLQMFLREQSKQAILHPAGTNQHTDIGFLDRDFGSVIGTFCDYHWMDMGTVRLFLKYAGLDLPDAGGTDHRTRTCLDRDINNYMRALQVARHGNQQKVTAEDLECAYKDVFKDDPRDSVQIIRDLRDSE